MQIPIRKKKPYIKMWQSVLDHLKLPFLFHYHSLSLITVSKKKKQQHQTSNNILTYKNFL